jgi:hypothetical protein
MKYPYFSRYLQDSMKEKQTQTDQQEINYLK